MYRQNRNFDYADRVENSIIAYILHLKDYTLVLGNTPLQSLSFTLEWRSIKRKCVKMIQPVSAFSPRVGFRGFANKTQKSSQEKTRSQVALINAATTSIAAGGLTTAIARIYTSSWSHAGVLGICGSVLSMFFIAPILVENTNLLKSQKKQVNDSGMKTSSKATAVVKDALKPTKKLVQFRQS